MGRFGIGHSAGRVRPQVLSKSLTPVAPPLITPAAAWTGAAASGFASAPSDPLRNTAKPACHLITLPNQFFADELLVGVLAYANNAGTLIDGIGQVDFYFENDIPVSVSTPSVQTFNDANGNPVSYLGYWAVLKKPAGASGEAQLYAEAIPADATMQSRVIGPYSFFPHDPFPATGTLHDYELAIAPSQPVVAGVSYQTFGAALAYLRNESLSVTVQNPLITFTEGGAIDLTATFWAVRMQGWCNVKATLPTTITKPLSARDTDASFRPKLGDFRFIGSNITFDTANAIQFYTEAGHRLAFDGVNFLDSRGRVGGASRGGPALISKWARENPYFLECTITNIHNACNEATLVRGGTMTGCSNDLFTDAACVVYTAADLLDVDMWAVDVDALTVQYTGAGATATLERNGTSDAGSLNFIAKVDGATVGTFNVQNSLTAFNAGTNYSVQNVADWLNGLTGFTATVLDDTRRATGLSLQGNRGTLFAATDVKTAAVTLATHFDLHSDWYAVNFGGQGENVIVAHNTATRLGAQSIFVAASSPRPKDFIFVNNALSNRTTNPTGSLDMTFLLSQFGGAGPQSHVVLAHCSIPTQSLSLRSDQGYDPDGYCLIANNAIRAIDWVGTFDPDIVVKDNAIDAGKTAPANSTGTIIGGDYTSKFADSLNGDFTPAGELVANPKAPVVTYDEANTKRGASAPVGAFA